MTKMRLYGEFFRAYVLRKRQELVNPKFLSIGEIVLPKFSQIHHVPRSPEEYGPGVTEAFISNFPKEVFIDFYTDFTPVVGKGHTVPFDRIKAIKAYRNSHFNYNWTRNVSSIYNREAVLLCTNYGLMERAWTYRPSLFLGFERHYNQFHQVLSNIQVEAQNGKRKQYIRVDLPVNMPNYIGFATDYEHYKKSFNAGVPNVTKQAIRLTKAEGCYWLLDLFAMLLGEHEYSLFNLLDKTAKDETHLIFTFNSKCLIVNLGLILSWFEDLKGGTKRPNATKRFYLALLKLSRGGSSVDEDQDTDKGNEDETLWGQESEYNLGDDEEPSLRDTKAAAKAKDVPRETPGVGTGAGATDILDVFGGSKESNPGPDEVGAAEEARGDSGDIEAWDSEVDDKLLEEEPVVEIEALADKVVFKNPTSGIEIALNERAKDGSLTVAEQEFFVRKGQRYESIEMANGQTMDEFIKITPAELEDLGGHIKGEFTTILDESMLRSRATSLKVDYAKKFLQKDIASMMLGIQNAGICLNNVTTETIRNVEGSFDVYKMEVHPVGGAQSTLPFRVPTVEDDGTFRIDGVKQHMQLQRRELPIRKINARQVKLTSYYDNQIMISRSEKVVNDYGRWLLKQIRLNAAGGEVTLSNGNVYDKTMKTPRIYSILAHSFKTLKTKNWEFDFDYHGLCAKHEEFKKYNKMDKFLIGVKAGKPITIDEFGNVTWDDKVQGTIEGMLKVNIAKAPLERVEMKVSGYDFPIGVVLCYYFGIDKLLKLVNATYRTVPMGTRPQPTEDEYAIKFADEYLVLNKRERLPALIFSGLVKLNNISNFSRSDLNGKGVWVPLMADPKVKTRHFAEMDLIFKMFIDPITKGDLEKMKMPTSLHYLLIEAVKLLVNDYTRHEVELEEQRFAGYERFAGHLYGELVKSARQFYNKGNDKRNKMDLNPESVIMKIVTDASVNLVEDVTPVHQVKDQEELTFGGTGGRSELSMVKRTRGQLKSYTGVISEANKDNAKVGFVTYTTSDPRVSDFRGNIDVNGKNTNAGLASVTGNLQYGMTLDSPNRVSFQSTQGSQAVAAQNYTFNVLRTGYDNVLAHRTNEIYSKIAKKDGVVTEVTSEVIKVKYANGTEDSYPLGLIIGEAAGEYHRHTRVTKLKVGDKFKEGSILGFDEQWFEWDPFCPGQVSWKCGKVVRIALGEDQGLFEDSLEISARFAEECVTPYIKAKTFLFDQDQGVKLFAKLGMDVGYDSILCDIEDAHLEGVEEEEAAGFEGINRFGIRQVKSNHHGKIVNIDLVYNAKLDDMSPSVKGLVQTFDRERTRKAKLVNAPITTGSINSSFSVKKESIPPGKIKVTVHIEARDSSVSADKYVVGNQMKGTVGRIMHEPLTTLDGRVIDLRFSYKSLFNRMVLSLRNKLIVCELAIHVTGLAVDIYRGKK